MSDVGTCARIHRVILYHMIAEGILQVQRRHLRHVHHEAIPVQPRQAGELPARQGCLPQAAGAVEEEHVQVLDLAEHTRHRLTLSAAQS